MTFKLPESVKNGLAQRSMRLHHLLWHTVRNNWHKFNPAEQEVFQHNYPNWVPLKPRFVRYPTGLVMVNNDAGESFLYMHRQMLAIVNNQLSNSGKPAIVPWETIPAPDDADYPVPGRNTTEDKSDHIYYQELLVREKNLLNPETLRKNNLAQIGAYLESSIHDVLHRRWAEVSPGLMINFPVLDPKNMNPAIASTLDSPDVDWLKHPYSSHVNSIFWVLHAWCDQVIEHWRIANNVSYIEWTDKWVGSKHHEEMYPKEGMKDNLWKHNHPNHSHHAELELFKVFKTLNSFEDCQIGFDYLEKNNIPLPELN